MSSCVIAALAAMPRCGRDIGLLSAAVGPYIRRKPSLVRMGGGGGRYRCHGFSGYFGTVIEASKLPRDPITVEILDDHDET